MQYAAIKVSLKRLAAAAVDTDLYNTWKEEKRGDSPYHRNNGYDGGSTRKNIKV